MYLFGFFRSSGHGLLNDTAHRRFVLHLTGVNEFPHGFYLPVFALSLIGCLYHSFIQCRVVLLTSLQLLQKAHKFVCGFILCLLQLFQCAQRPAFAPQLGKKVVQLTGRSGNKLGCRLIGRQLPSFTHFLQRGIFLALGDVFQNGSVELPGGYGEAFLIVASGHQRIEGLEHILSKRGKRLQFFTGALLDFIHTGIVMAQIVVDAALKLGGAQYPVSLSLRLLLLPL